jgi:hypothetical protein
MADIYGNVSAAGGFDQSEVEFVTNLINSGQVSVADVAKQFGLPESIISAAYEANRPAVEPALSSALHKTKLHLSRYLLLLPLLFLLLFCLTLPIPYRAFLCLITATTTLRAVQGVEQEVLV